MEATNQIDTTTTVNTVGDPNTIDGTTQVLAFIGEQLETGQTIINYQANLIDLKNQITQIDQQVQNQNSKVPVQLMQDLDTSINMLSQVTQEITPGVDQLRQNTAQDPLSAAQYINKVVLQVLPQLPVIENRLLPNLEAAMLAIDQNQNKGVLDYRNKLSQLLPGVNVTPQASIFNNKRFKADTSVNNPTYQGTYQRDPNYKNFYLATKLDEESDKDFYNNYVKDIDRSQFQASIQSLVGLSGKELGQQRKTFFDQTINPLFRMVDVFNANFQENYNEQTRQYNLEDAIEGMNALKDQYIGGHYEESLLDTQKFDSLQNKVISELMMKQQTTPGGQVTEADLKVATIQAISAELSSLVSNPNLVTAIKLGRPEYREIAATRNGSAEHNFYQAYLRDNPFVGFNGQNLLVQMVDGIRSLINLPQMQNEPSTAGIQAALSTFLNSVYSKPDEMLKALQDPSVASLQRNSYEQSYGQDKVIYTSRQGNKAANVQINTLGRAKKVVSDYSRVLTEKYTPKGQQDLLTTINNISGQSSLFQDPPLNFQVSVPALSQFQQMQQQQFKQSVQQVISQTQNQLQTIGQFDQTIGSLITPQVQQMQGIVQGGDDQYQSNQANTLMTLSGQITQTAQQIQRQPQLVQQLDQVTQDHQTNQRIFQDVTQTSNLLQKVLTNQKNIFTSVSLKDDLLELNKNIDKLQTYSFSQKVTNILQSIKQNLGQAVFSPNLKIDDIKQNLNTLQQELTTIRAQSFDTVSALRKSMTKTETELSEVRKLNDRYQADIEKYNETLNDTNANLFVYQISMDDTPNQAVLKANQVQQLIQQEQSQFRRYINKFQQITGTIDQSKQQSSKINQELYMSTKELAEGLNKVDRTLFDTTQGVTLDSILQNVVNGAVQPNDYKNLAGLSEAIKTQMVIKNMDVKQLETQMTKYTSSVNSIYDNLQKQKYTFEGLQEEIKQLREDGTKLNLPESLLDPLEEEKTSTTDTAQKAVGLFRYQLKDLNDSVNQSIGSLKSDLFKSTNLISSIRDRSMKLNELDEKKMQDIAKLQTLLIQAPSYEDKSDNIVQLKTLDQFEDQLKKIEQTITDKKVSNSSLQGILATAREKVFQLKVEQSQNEALLKQQDETFKRESDIVLKNNITQSFMDKVNLRERAQAEATTLLQSNNFNKFEEAFSLQRGIFSGLVNQYENVNEIIDRAIDQAGITQKDALIKFKNNYGGDFRTILSDHQQELAKLYAVQDPVLKETAKVTADSYLKLFQQVLTSITTVASMKPLSENPQDKEYFSKQVAKSVDTMNNMQSLALQFKTTVADITNLDKNLQLVTVFQNTDPLKATAVRDNALNQLQLFGIQTKASLLSFQNSVDNFAPDSELAGKAAQIMTNFRNYRKLADTLDKENQNFQGVDQSVNTEIKSFIAQFKRNLQEQDAQVIVQRNMSENTERVLSRAIYSTMLKSVHNQIAQGEDFRLEQLDSDVNTISSLMLDGGHLNNNDMVRAKDALRSAFMEQGSQFKTDILEKIGQAMGDQVKSIVSELDMEGFSKAFTNKAQAKSMILDSYKRYQNPDQLGDNEQIVRLDEQFITELNEKRKELVANYRDIITDPDRAPARTALLQTQQNTTIKENLSKRMGAPVEQVFFSGRFGSDSRDLSKDLQVQQLSKYQERIQRIPKEEIKEEEQRLQQSRVQQQTLLKTLDKSSQQSAGDSAIVDQMKYNLFQQAAQIWTAQNQSDIQKSYRSINYNGPPKLSTLFESPQFANVDRRRFFLDYTNNLPEIAAGVVTPIQDKIDKGIIPVKDDFLMLESLIQLNDQVQQMADVNHDFADSERQAEINILTGGDVPVNERYQRIRNQVIQQREVYIETVKNLIKGNLKFIDSADKILEERAGQSQNRFDQQLRANEQLEKYANSFQDGVINSLMRVKLQGFMNNDAQSQQLMQQSRGMLAPRFVGQQQSAATQQQALQSQQQQQMQQPQERKQFLAFQGSQAEQSGDPGKNRLTDKAYAQMQGLQGISPEDITFIRQVYFNEDKKKLLFRESEQVERDLTKDEKRKYIRILITALLALYTDQVKQLSKQERKKAETNLMAKYVSKGGNTDTLVRMINKISARMQNTMPEFVRMDQQQK